MKNNKENKAKFFAQYWGQEIMKEFDDDLSETVYMSNPHANKSNISEYYLELKPLSKITDEDAKYIADLFTDEDGDVFTGKMIVEMVCEFTEESYLYNLNCQAVDYLRSKGYALPYLNLKIDNLIEYGWVKLATAGRSLKASE